MFNKTSLDTVNKENSCLQKEQHHLEMYTRTNTDTHEGGNKIKKQLIENGHCSSNKHLSICNKSNLDNNVHIQYSIADFYNNSDSPYSYPQYNTHLSNLQEFNDYSMVNENECVTNISMLCETKFDDVDENNVVEDNDYENNSMVKNHSDKFVNKKHEYECRTENEYNKEYINYENTVTCPNIPISNGYTITHNENMTDNNCLDDSVIDGDQPICNNSIVTQLEKKRKSRRLINNQNSSHREDNDEFNKFDDNINQNKPQLCCTFCPEIFICPNNLFQHVLVHSLEKYSTFVCCDESFCLKTALLKHVKQQHGENDNLVCLYCNETYEGTSAFKEHLNSHPNQDYFVCICCKKAFKRRNSLKKHLYLTHITKYLNYYSPCNMCKGCSVNKIFSSHFEPVNNSNKSNIHENSYNNNINNNNTVNVNNISQHNDTEEYDNKNLENRKFDQNYVQNKNVKFLPRNNKINSCQRCDKIFIKKNSLTRHLKTCINKKIYLCAHCDSGFTNKAKLIPHFATHKQQKYLLNNNNQHVENNKTDGNTDKLLNVTNLHTSSKDQFIHKKPKVNEKKYRNERSVTKRRHHCSYCNMSFSSQYNCDKHENTRHKHGIPCKKECPLCNECFHLHSRYRYHMLTYHNPKRMISAQQNRNWKPVQKLDLNNSSKLHNVTSSSIYDGKTTKIKFNIIFQNSFSCEYCYSAFRMKRKYFHHLRKIHKMKPKAPNIGTDIKNILNCVLCDKRLGTNEQIRLHIKEDHYLKKLYTCAYCKETFCTPTIFLQHIKSKHGISDLCPIDLYNRFKQINKTECEIKKSLFCPLCGSRTCSREYLAGHIKQEHGYDDSIDVPDVVTDIKNVPSCVLCKNNVPVDTKIIRKHIKEDHFRERHFSCHYCQGVFSTKRQILKHIYRLHDIQIQQKSVCGRILSICDANRRMENLINKTNMQDEFVNKPSSSNNQDVILQREIEELFIKKNISEQTIYCPVCKKCCLNREEFTEHLKSHSNEPPDKNSFTCTYCGKSFNVKDVFKKHVSDKHSVKTISCEFCDVEFSSKFSLIKHITSSYQCHIKFISTVL